MAKKDYYLIIDTETTKKGKVADFGAVLTDRKGNVIKQCAVLVADYFNNRSADPLFYVDDDPNGIWAKKSLDTRYKRYHDMLNSGARMLAGVNAVNRWLLQCEAAYSPIITAYNFGFDRDKCEKSGIDLTIFSDRYFCLWYASAQKWAKTKKYRKFILENHAFNSPTQFGNMTYKTNAEVMARFVLDQPDLPDEPHTALEDVLYYELPVFKRLIQTTPKKVIMGAGAYSWQDYQVKNSFTV